MTEEISLITPLKNGWIKRNSDGRLINLHQCSTVHSHKISTDVTEYQILIPTASEVAPEILTFRYPEERELEEGQQDFAEHNWKWDLQRIENLLNQ